MPLEQTNWWCFHLQLCTKVSFGIFSVEKKLSDQAFLQQRNYEVVEALLGEWRMQSMWRKTSLTENHQIYVITWRSTTKSAMTVHSRDNVTFSFTQIPFKLKGDILKTDSKLSHLNPLNQSFCFSFSIDLETNWISRYSLQTFKHPKTILEI